MSIDEHFDHFDSEINGRLHGEVHGLLATAFDDGVPVVNVVPGAVDGFRRHRRRTRVLGTAGGALVLAGAITAGTALAGTGTRSGNTAAGAAHESSTAGGSTAPGGSTSGGSGQSAAELKDPLCEGRYRDFNHRPGDGTYTADDATLARVCAGDLAHLREAIPGATVTPQSETYQHALAVHDIPPGTPAPAGAPEDTRWLRPGSYLVEVGGRKTSLSLAVADRQEWAFNDCWTSACPPNLTLADGTPATMSPASSFEGGTGIVSLHPDATHWVALSASVADGTKEQHSLPIDFAKVIRTKAFAEMAAFDLRNLKQLS